MSVRPVLVLAFALGCAHRSPTPRPAQAVGWNDRAVVAMFEVVALYDQGVQLDAALNPADEHHNARIDAVFAYQADLFLPLVEQWGWPGDGHGDGSLGQTLWLVAQHADARPEAQVRFLEALERSEPSTRAARRDLAYLTDRVRKNAGRPQVYGTQFVHDDGTCAFHPIEDPARADVLRAELGLEPLSEAMAAHEEGERLMFEAFKASQPPSP